MSELENYLDDSDFLSSSDEEAGFISSDDEENNNQLINSIINKKFTSFLELIKNKKCLKEQIYDNIIEKALNPLHISLKTYQDYNDINFITKLVETKHYNLDEAILFSIFNYDCYNYYKHLTKNMFIYKNEDNDNILTWACKYSDLKVVYDVYDNIKNTKEKNKEGFNCFLSTALNYNSKNIFEIINFLIDKNINFINTVDNNNDNFLMLLENNRNIKVKDNNKSIIVKFLYDNGININHQNNSGKNILMNIIENCNYLDWKHLHDYVYFYIRNEINLDVTDNNNKSILEYCIKNVTDQIKLINKKNIKLLANEFIEFKKTFNLIVENKETFTAENKKNMKDFKKTLIKNNLA